MTPEILQKLTDDLLAHLAQRGESYTLNTGEKVKGQAASFLQSEMRSLGWRNLGSLSDFEAECENAGFRVLGGRNRRGQPCRVVTL